MARSVLLDGLRRSPDDAFDVVGGAVVAVCAVAAPWSKCVARQAREARTSSAPPASRRKAGPRRRPSGPAPDRTAERAPRCPAPPGPSTRRRDRSCRPFSRSTVTTPWATSVAAIGEVCTSPNGSANTPRSRIEASRPARSAGCRGRTSDERAPTRTPDQAKMRSASQCRRWWCDYSVLVSVICDTVISDMFTTTPSPPNSLPIAATTAAATKYTLMLKNIRVTPCIALATSSGEVRSPTKTSRRGHASGRLGRRRGAPSPGPGDPAHAIPPRRSGSRCRPHRQAL